VTETTTATAASAAPKSLAARIIGVVTSPRETYASVAAHPRWFGVLAVIVLVGATGVFALMSTDVGKAKAFYGKLLDWKLEDMPMPDNTTYTMVNVGEGTGGGLMKNPIPGAPSMWMPYVLVDDLKAATAKAKSLGGTVMRENVEVQGMGTFSIITDPAGAMIGLWETAGG
jgi:predicted enzyme related to lactoylglutathione lyase